MKRTQSASAQLGQGKHAPRLPSAGIITEVSRPPAKRVVDEMSDRDSGFAPQTEEPARPSSQSLSSSSSRTISQRSFSHPASKSKNNQREPQNTRIPKIKLFPPGDPATVLGQRNKTVTVSSPTPDSRADRSTSIDPKKLLHPPRSRSPGSLKVQQHKVMADEAHKALHVVIGYCKQQPTGFLDFQDSVVLGKLDERLRCCSN
jgi:hypothetical protein